MSLKGLAAYAKHAAALGKENPEINAFLEHTLADVLNDSLSADDLTALALKTGEYGVQVMALLDEANTQAYGNPEITKVKISAGNRPGISYLVMISEIWKCFWNRQKIPGWTSTLIPKCFRLTTILPLKSIPTLSAIMETHGGSRKKNLKVSMVRFL